MEVSGEKGIIFHHQSQNLILQFSFEWLLNGLIAGFRQVLILTRLILVNFIDD